jgi:hypothetical protein
MRIGRGNQSTLRTPTPSATFSITNPIRLDLGSNPGRRGGKPATNSLSYSTVNSLDVPSLTGSWRKSYIKSFTICTLDKNYMNDNSRKSNLMQHLACMGKIRMHTKF